MTYTDADLEQSGTMLFTPDIHRTGQAGYDSHAARFFTEPV